MAIWNEIKRSINSDLDKPLNKLIGSSDDNTTVMDKLDSLLNDSGGGGVQYIDSHINRAESDVLPYVFSSGSAVVYDNQIHLLGLNNTYHYKWDGSSWSSVSTLPYNFYGGSAVVYNNQIHILGCSDSTYRTSHYKWNGSSWSNASTLPYQFKQGSAVVYDNEIHILGSYVSTYYKYHYKWDGSSWTSVSTLPLNYTSHYKWNGSSWFSVSTLPYAFVYGSAVVYNGEIHMLGSSASGRSHHKISQLTNILLYSEVNIYAMYNGTEVCINITENVEIPGTIENDMIKFSVSEPGCYGILSNGTITIVP